MPKSEKTGETATATAERPPKRTGRPPKSEDRIPKVIGFFNRVQSINKEDWGTRAYITVYRLEPSIDRTRLGEPKHIAKYSEPVDADRIKVDQGSGRYRLYLGFKAPTEKTERELDSIEIDILDMNFPPKLARGEWLDIPYNKKWEWCRTMLPATPTQQVEQRQSAVGELAETLEVLDGITSRAREQAKPTEAPARESTLDIIKGVKEMMTPPAPATENKMLDTVVALLTKQIDSQAAANSELRKEIADMRNNPKDSKGGILGNLTGIVGEVKSILPDLKEMFPALGEKVGAVSRAVRSNMTGDQEFWQPIVNRIVEAITPAVPMFVNRLMTPTNGQQPQQPPTLLQPAPGAQAPGPGAAPPATGPEPQPFNPQQAFEFLKAHAKPFLDWFKDGMPGGEFAESIFNLYGADWQGLPWLHAKQTFGADNIVAIFKKSPFWPEIATMEAAFGTFVTDFVAWQPGQEPPPDGQTINTTAQEAGN